VWTLRAPDGRWAVFCGDDPEAMNEMAREIFGSCEGLVVEERRGDGA
jgi:hypothetical protein